MDKEEFAWRLYESERDFIKHHENQRTNASSILAAISAGLIVALTSDVATETSRLMIAVSLFLVGVFGSVFSGKLYQLIHLHASRSYAYLAVVNSNFPEVDVKKVKAGVTAEQKNQFPYFSSISLNKIWFRFHLLITAFGLALTIMIAVDLYVGRTL
jgi:phosphate/sulfate permease